MHKWGNGRFLHPPGRTEKYRNKNEGNERSRNMLNDNEWRNAKNMEMLDSWRWDKTGTVEDMKKINGVEGWTVEQTMLWIINLIDQDMIKIVVH